MNDTQIKFDPNLSKLRHRSPPYHPHYRDTAIEHKITFCYFVIRDTLR